MFEHLSSLYFQLIRGGPSPIFPGGWEAITHS